jgi:hypothetical protein
LLAIYKRRMMTDRLILIWIFMFIIVAGIFGPGDVKPPTPDKIQNCYEGKEGSGCT